MTQESANLEEWRDWLTHALMLVGSIAFLPGVLFTFPVYIADKHYGLVAMDIALWIFFLFRLIYKGGSFRFRAYLWLSVLYGMTLTYFVTLGPHYARSAWLVGCVIMSAVLFGTRAAIVSTSLNAAMLMVLYWLVDPANPAWTSTLADSWLKWAMFVTNVSIVTLVTSLPVGFLLDHLNRALERGRKTRHELAVESAKMHGLMEGLPGLFYMCDRGRLVRWNRRLEEVLGYSSEELENIYAPDLFAAEDRERVARAAERASIHGQAEEEVLFATKDSSRISHYWVGSRIMVGDRPHLVGIAIDITDRLQAEASVRASERKYRNLVENAPLGIIACDLQGQISSVNRILLEVLGSPSAAATSEINVLTFPPLVEAGIADRIRRCMDKEESSVSEHLYHTKWGRSVYMRLYLTPTRDANGAITGAQGIVEDTTERVQAEQARRESEERLQLSLQAADLGLWSMDVASATFVVNSHWARILGYPPDRLEYTADRWQALTHPDDLNRVQEAVSEHVHQRTPSYQVEYRFRSGLGEWEWISARGKVVEWSDDGQPLRMAGTHLLITESRRTEQELRQYRDHLEELVQERTTELRRAVNLMAGREVRMAELKETIRQLHAQLVKAGIVPIDRNVDPAGAIESENNFSSSKESRGKETIPNP